MNQNIESHVIEKREDYEKILSEFGISKIDKILPRIGTDNLFFRRGVVFAHRDFGKILDRVEQKKSFAIISGRGPSNDLHFGHLILYSGR